eukprot:scaffold188924_cov28-Prasinocladus_malaysianus.AAC.1
MASENFENDGWEGIDSSRLFQEGYTIAIRGLSQRNRFVTSLCSALSSSLGLLVGANAYLTPSGMSFEASFFIQQPSPRIACQAVGSYWLDFMPSSGAQGLAAHVDDHCVMVLQIEGKKSWRLKRFGSFLPRLGDRMPKNLSLKDQVWQSSSRCHF